MDKCRENLEGAIIQSFEDLGNYEGSTDEAVAIGKTTKDLYALKLQEDELAIKKQEMIDKRQAEEQKLLLEAQKSKNELTATIIHTAGEGAKVAAGMTFGLVLAKAVFDVEQSGVIRSKVWNLIPNIAKVIL